MILVDIVLEDMKLVDLVVDMILVDIVTMKKPACLSFLKIICNAL